MQIKLKRLFIMLPIMFALIGTITAIMTYVNLSAEQTFISAWGASFIFAFVVMLPAGGILFALMNKFVNRFFSTWPQIQKNLLQGVFMAVVMESIMAMVTTVTNHDTLALQQFLGVFINSFLYALPVGLTFACLMTLVLQPRLERFLAASTVEVAN